MTFIDPSGASRSALVSHEEVEAWVNGCHGHRTCSLLNFDAEKVTKPGADFFRVWELTINLVTELKLPI